MKKKNIEIVEYDCRKFLFNNLDNINNELNEFCLQCYYKAKYYLYNSFFCFGFYSNFYWKFETRFPETEK